MLICERVYEDHISELREQLYQATQRIHELEQEILALRREIGELVMSGLQEEEV